MNGRNNSHGPTRLIPPNHSEPYMISFQAISTKGRTVAAWQANRHQAQRQNQTRSRINLALPAEPALNPTEVLVPRLGATLSLRVRGVLYIP